MTFWEIVALAKAGQAMQTAEDNSLLDYKGIVAEVSDLPSDASDGDVYRVEANGNLYAFGDGTWGDIGDLLVLDDELDETSTNAVQNKAIKEALDGKADKRTGEGEEVYTHDGTTQGGRTLTETPTAGAVPMFLTGGRLKSNEPRELDDVARIQEIQKMQENTFNVPYTPSNMSKGSDGLIWLEKGYLDASTGQSMPSTTGKYYKTQVGNSGSNQFLQIGGQPLLLHLGLDWVQWLCWSYSGVTSGSATHSNTGERYMSGMTDIYIPATPPDVRFAVCFRTLGASDAARPAFTDAQLTELKQAIRFLRATDTSLSTAGAAADAKAAGNRISALETAVAELQALVLENQGG